VTAWANWVLVDPFEGAPGDEPELVALDESEVDVVDCDPEDGERDDGELDEGVRGEAPDEEVTADRGLVSEAAPVFFRVLLAANVEVPVVPEPPPPRGKK
jgi:hypothetical protein